MIPIDPDNPVHSLALVLAVILVGTSAASIFFTDVLAADQKLPPLMLGDLLGQELPFLIIGLAGVGIWVRRDLATTAARLGVVVPAWWHVILALAAAGAFYAFGEASHSLSQVLTPGLANQVDSSSQHLFGGLSAGTGGILALALIPGICEDVLFRGALQPRFGLVLTAFLFAAIHTEYAFSFDAPFDLHHRARASVLIRRTPTRQPAHVPRGLQPAGRFTSPAPRCPARHRRRPWCWS